MRRATNKTVSGQANVAPVWRISAGKQQSAPREREPSCLGQLRSSNEPALSKPGESSQFEKSPRICFLFARSSRFPGSFESGFYSGTNVLVSSAAQRRGHGSSTLGVNRAARSR
ncbi:MAG: hypothetical protein CMJ75_06570 [Planctomycetaceae bacterium]|nr:hypothetical protein [Planctomycetaceae bacterium]